ncbi:MAG: 50S ribosomal protein L11 methyltransferase [Deltaproteobacteria bacterium]|jgi:ribosomal protein L11 methylase PrmA|nr:50S ribosomal protein L11 methyltransferase [Deltaproteobacteria bacterium]
MRPETLLTIYELKVPDPRSRDLLDQADLKGLLGESLAGFHWEADFAFLFCLAPLSLDPLHARIPGLELQTTHLLRYDEWQDGAAATPLYIGPLAILPWREGAGEPALAPRERASLGGYPQQLPPLYIDPGLAFGYGGHPTTKACLSFLSRLFCPQSPAIPLTALDLGSGTGVLSLAAARLGALKVLGVDHSHLAAENANFNARLNNLDSQVAFVRGSAADYARAPGELVMANIPLFVHWELLALKAYSGRKYLILSGLLPREAEKLLEGLAESLSFSVLDSHRDERWSSYLVAVTGERL